MTAPTIFSRAQKRIMGICYECKRKAKKGRRRCTKHLMSNTASVLRCMSTPGGKARVVEMKRRNRLALNSYARDRRSHAGRFAYVRRAARRAGFKWSISKKQFYELVAMSCHYCGMPNNVRSSRGLDRLDNKKGYTSTNVVGCCKECNTARSFYFTPNEMKIIGLAIREVKLMRQATKSKGEP